MLGQSSIKMLMLVHELEKTLGIMYDLFAGRFPDHHRLWDVLRRDEKQHAESVRMLYRLTYDGLATFDAGSIRAEAVQSIIAYVNGVCDAARRGRISEQQALAATYDAERSLIERDIFRHFRVSEPYAHTLLHLQKDTEHHIQLSRDTLAGLLSHNRKKGHEIPYGLHQGAS